MFLRTAVRASDDQIDPFPGADRKHPLCHCPHARVQMLQLATHCSELTICVTAAVIALAAIPTLIIPRHLP
ncbi:MAG: hypothetical protein ACK55I_13465, partial [bacterium]